MPDQANDSSTTGIAQELDDALATLDTALLQAGRSVAIIRHNLPQLSFGGLLSSIAHFRFTRLFNFPYLLPSVKQTFSRAVSNLRSRSVWISFCLPASMSFGVT